MAGRSAERNGVERTPERHARCVGRAGTARWLPVPAPAQGRPRPRLRCARDLDDAHRDRRRGGPDRVRLASVLPDAAGSASRVGARAADDERARAGRAPAADGRRAAIRRAADAARIAALRRRVRRRRAGSRVRDRRWRTPRGGVVRRRLPVRAGLRAGRAGRRRARAHDGTRKRARLGHRPRASCRPARPTARSSPCTSQ